MKSPKLRSQNETFYHQRKEMNYSITNHLKPIWTIPELLSKGGLRLPSFQRDAVWDEERLELLWDSLMRAMPIGNFIVARCNSILYRELQGSRSDAGQKIRRHERSSENQINSEENYQNLLIDGQQRAIGIQQGLLPWNQDRSYRLWIDVAPSNNQTRRGYAVKYPFFLCTKALPWGVGVTDSQWRKCRDQLNDNHPTEIENGDVKKPDYQLPLGYTWPGKANLPIPFANIVECVTKSLKVEGDIIDQKWSAEKRINKQDIKKNIENLIENCTASQNIKKEWEANKEQIVEWVNTHQKRIREVLTRNIFFEKAFDIDCLVDPEELGEAFNRINRLGVQLTNAELFFSALKLLWPDAHDLMWSIYDDPRSGKILSPPDIVHVAVRLATARKNKESSTENKALADRLNLSLSDVRVLLSSDASQKNILDELKLLLEENSKTSLKALFGFMKELLEFQFSSDKLDFGIPVPLLDRIGSKRPHIFHNILAWLATTSATINISDHDLRLRMVRYVISDYFFISVNNEYRRNSFVEASKGPPVFPDEVIMRLAVGDGWDLRSEFMRSESDNTFLTPEEFQKKIVGRYDPINLRELLLWAQRLYLKEAFPDYDPTLFFTVSSLPWDEDHILPRAIMDRRSQVCEDDVLFERCKSHYLNSFGNFRLLDKRENRGDGSAMPKEKLFKVAPEKYFAISNANLIDWVNLDIRDHTLTEDFFNNFIKAVETRRCNIYQNLHETLQLGYLKIVNKDDAFK
jgi:hypothetical protein